jgi:O-antigen ligase
VNKSKIISLRNISLAALGLSLMALPFSIPFCHVAFILYLGCWLAEGRWREKVDALKNNFVLQLLLAFAAMQLISIIYSQNASQSWFSIEKKIFFFLIPVALTTSVVKFSTKEIKILLYVFTATCFVAVVICLVHAGWNTMLLMQGRQSFADIAYLDTAELKALNSAQPTPWLFFSYAGLASGILIHPSYLSLYLSFSIAFILHELFANEELRKKRRFALGFLVLLFSSIIIFLSARIIIFSLIIIYLAIACYYVFIKKVARISVYIVALIAVVCCLLYLNPVTRYRNVQEVKNSSLEIEEKKFYDTSIEIRASLWWLAWKTYQSVNPLMGTGNGDVGTEMKETGRKYQITNVLETYDPHNQYLFILISNGIIGLMIFILLIALPFIQAIARQDYLYVAFIFILSSLCLTESALELQKGIAFFAIFFPLLTFHRQAVQSDFATLKYFSARS